MENENVKTNGFKEKLTSVKNWIMKTTNGMAIGLFGTLIIGTIIDLFAKIPLGFDQIVVWASVVKGLMGAGIGLGVALSLKLEGVSIVMAAAAGAIGNYAFMWLPSDVNQWHVVGISDPLSCYLSVVVAVLVVKAVVRKKTPVDLILIPLLGTVTAMLFTTA